MLIAAFAIGVTAGDLQNFTNAFESASIVYSTIDRVGHFSFLLDTIFSSCIVY